MDREDATEANEGLTGARRRTSRLLEAGLRVHEREEDVRLDEVRERTVDVDTGITDSRTES